MGNAMLLFAGKLPSKCLWILCISVVLVRPIIVLQLRFVLRVAVFHSDTARQDRGDIIAHRFSFCLLFLLLLNFFQLDTCSTNKHTQTSATQPIHFQWEIHKSLWCDVGVPGNFTEVELSANENMITWSISCEILKSSVGETEKLMLQGAISLFNMVCFCPHAGIK